MCRPTTSQPFWPQWSQRSSGTVAPSTENDDKILKNHLKFNIVEHVVSAYRASLAPRRVHTARQRSKHILFIHLNALKMRKLQRFHSSESIAINNFNYLICVKAKNKEGKNVCVFCKSLKVLPALHPTIIIIMRIGFHSICKHMLLSFLLF